MSKSNCIFFIHHLDLTSGVTQHNYNLFVRHNPQALVVPLAYTPEMIEMCQDVAAQPLSQLLATPAYVGPAYTRQFYSDMLVYGWFKAHQPTQERYFIFEYDTHCNCPVDEFYGAVLDKPAAASVILSPTSSEKMAPDYPVLQKDWEHFKYWRYGCTPAEITAIEPHITGAAPGSGIMFQRETLVKILATLKDQPTFTRMQNELRMGSIASYVGARPVAIRPDSYLFLYWELREPSARVRRGVFHWVKKIV